MRAFPLVLVGVVGASIFAVAVADDTTAPTTPLMGDQDTVTYDIFQDAAWIGSLNYTWKGWTRPPDFPAVAGPARLLVAEELDLKGRRTQSFFFVSAQNEIVAWTHELTNATAYRVSLLLTEHVYGKEGLAKPIPGVRVANHRQEVRIQETRYARPPILCGFLDRDAKTELGPGCEFVPGRGNGRAAIAPDFVYDGSPYPQAVGHRVDGASIVVLRRDVVRGGEPMPESARPADRPIRVPPKLVFGLPADQSLPAEPFRLQDAIQRAENDPRCLLGFRAQHPNAYVAAAHSTLVVAGSVSHRQWTLVFGPGDAQTSPFNAAVAVIRDLPPSAIPHEVPRSIYVSNDVDCTETYLPLLPPTISPSLALPEPKWLAQVWAKGQPGPADSWGFTLLCSDELCRTSQAKVWAGRSVVRLGAQEQRGFSRDVTRQGQSGTFDVLGYDTSAAEFFRLNGTENFDAGLLPGAMVGSQRELLGGARAGAMPPTPGGPIGAGFGLAMGGAAIALGIVAGRWILSWWLYSRLSDDGILEHPKRRLILQVIQENPGIHYRGLLTRTNLWPGTLSHHVRVLERARRVQKRSTPGFTCYFAGPTVVTDQIAALSLVSYTSNWILQRVRDSPGLTVKELAAERAVHSSTIVHHLQRLERGGLIHRRRTQRGMEAVPTVLGLRFASRAADSSKLWLGGTPTSG